MFIYDVFHKQGTYNKAFHVLVSLNVKFLNFSFSLVNEILKFLATVNLIGSQMKSICL